MKTTNDDNDPNFKVAKKAVENNKIISHIMKHAKNVRWIELGPRRNNSHEFREGYHKSVNKTGPY